MQSIWVFQCEFQPLEQEAPLQCLAHLRQRLGQWVEGIYQRMGMPHVKVVFDGIRQRPMKPQLLWARTWSQGKHELSALILEYPDGARRGLWWRLNVQLACGRRLVQACLRAQAEFRPFQVMPFSVQIADNNPLAHLRPFLMQLAKERPAQLGGQPLQMQPTLLRQSHVASFVADVLLRPDRVLPLLVLDRDALPFLTDARLNDMQLTLYLLGHVAVLQNATAVKTFTKEVGEGLTCAEGLRIFYPAVRLKTPPAAAPYFRAPAAGAGFRDLLRKLQAVWLGLTPSRHVQGQIIRAARAAVHRDRRKAVRAASYRERLASMEEELLRSWVVQQQLTKERDESRRQLSHMETELAVARRMLAKPAAEASSGTPAPPTPLQDQFLDSLATEVEKLSAEKQRAHDELIAAEARVADLEAELANYKDNLAAMWHFASSETGSAEVSVPEHERDFANVSAALEAAAREFADVLIIWESAYHAARESPFPLPAKVFRALEAIAEVGREYFHAKRSGVSMGPLHLAFASRVPFKFTNFESATTLQRFGDTRVFHHAGQQRQMQRHLTFGGGETNLSLQIYFDFDDAAELVLIGYCGRHLPFTRQGK